MSDNQQFLTLMLAFLREVVIGPTLFLVYINDLIDCIKNQVYLFANDTTLSAIILNSMKSKTLVINSFQSDLKAIEEWSEKWLVIFNAKKTQIMTISRKKSKSINEDITFVNESLIEVENIKLLGINITSSLDGSYHSHKPSCKARWTKIGYTKKGKKNSSTCIHINFIQNKSKIYYGILWTYLAECFKMCSE